MRYVVRERAPDGGQGVIVCETIAELLEAVKVSMDRIGHVVVTVEKVDV